MILSFLPALLGSRASSVETAVPGTAPARGDSPGGLGFEALFLSLLGSGTQPPAEAPAAGAEDGPELPEGGSAEGEGVEGRTDAPSAGDATETTTSGPAASPLDAAEGKTTRAGWASLARTSDALPDVGGDAEAGLDLRIRSLRGRRMGPTSESSPASAGAAPGAGTKVAAASGAARRVDADLVVSPGPVRPIEAGLAEGREGAGGPRAAENARAASAGLDPVSGSRRDARVADPTPPAVAAEAVPPRRSADLAGEASAPSLDGTSDASDGPSHAVVEETPGASTASMSPSPAADPTLAAAAAPVVTAAARVWAADRSPDKLDPELRARVERVIERMSSEHGVDVTLGEGYRTPERQRHLYAQGRTRPGPVVTWTTDSLHSQGRAADLRVAGAESTREAYTLLQDVAREEGLHTLGMKDPGHVELRLDDGARPAGATPARASEPVEAMEPQRPPTRLAQVASVARAARVEQVARVAQTASTARVASTPPVASSAHGAHAAPRDLPSAASATAQAPAVQAVAAHGSPRPEPLSPREAAPGSARRTDPVEAAAFGPSSPSAHATPTAAATPTGATGAPETLARVDQILEARETLGDVFPQRVSIRLDGTAGPVERIRVEMTDQALRGDVQVSDARLAQSLRGDAGAILRTLQERGYDPQSLSVNQVRARVDAVTDPTGAAFRSESAADVLRGLVGTQAGGGSGRDAFARGQEQQGRHEAPRQGGQEQHSRRDDRRQNR